MLETSAEEKPISTGSFYSSKGYIPPLERKRKLESSFETPKKLPPDPKPNVNQAKRSNSENRIKKTPNRKVNKKNSKHPSTATKKSPVLSNSSKQNAMEKKIPSSAKPNHQKLPSETVSLNSVLSKKEPSINPEKRRFFKSRSSEISNNVLLRVENIIPKNSRLLLDTKIKENRPRVSIASVSTKDCASKQLKNNKTTPSKWLVSSFGIDSPERDDNVKEIEKISSSDIQKVVSKEAKKDKLLQSATEDSNFGSENASLDDLKTKESDDSGCQFSDIVSSTDGAISKQSSSDSDCFESSSILEPGLPQLEEDSCDVNGNCEPPVDIPSTAPQSDSMSANGSGDMYPVFRCAANKANMNTNGLAPENEDTKEKKRNRLSKSKLPKDEMFTLDAGQDMAPVVCQQCPIMYHKGSAEDERFHEKIHQKFTSIDMKFQGWKKERVIGNFLDGKIVMVTKDDKNYMVERAEKILDTVTRELGISHEHTSFKHNDVFLIYIHINSQIVGCLLAEPISKAYHMKGLEHVYKDADAPGKTEIGRKTSSSEPVKAVCGVNVLWVARGHDEEIAIRMIDCLRCNFAYGFLIENEQLAFSDASDSVLRLAAVYTKKDNFLTYK